jgi:uncharacterized membrane protein
MPMNANVSEWLNIIFRWGHVAAGIMWIGHLWFFNFVNAQLMKTYDADSKKKVLPELMPRALFWFRWGAAYTWVTGIVLLGLVYYMGGLSGSTLGNHAAMGIGLGSLVVSFAVYDMLWKSPLGKNEKAAAAVSFLLITGVAFGLSRLFGGRFMYIHIGSIFGTIMAANVWMRIWPAQRKIIAGVKGTGPAADPSVAALAGLRSKHNTYMSMPLIFLMISNHGSTMLSLDIGGFECNWLLVAGITLVAWGAVKFLYTKSASASPAQF